MESLALYRISDRYIRFLSGIDRRVPYNKGNHRPYIGVVLSVGEYRYFVPMESPKPNHINIKPDTHIMKLDGGRYGLLGFNNMLPVPDSALTLLDIDAEQDAQYADLLHRQITFINRHKAEVLNHAAKTYYKACNAQPNSFFRNVCCDFKKLEHSCKRYNPNYKKPQ